MRIFERARLRLILVSARRALSRRFGRAHVSGSAIWPRHGHASQGRRNGLLRIVPVRGLALLIERSDALRRHHVTMPPTSGVMRGKISKGAAVMRVRRIAPRDLMALRSWVKCREQGRWLLSKARVQTRLKIQAHNRRQPPPIRPESSQRSMVEKSGRTARKSQLAAKSNSLLAGLRSEPQILEVSVRGRIPCK